LGGLARKEYVIRCGDRDSLEARAWNGATWVSGNVLVDTREGATTSLEVRVRPADKLILRGAPESSAAMRFRIIDVGGLVLAEGSFQGSQPRALALPAGNYRVSLLDPLGAALAERSVALRPDSTGVDFSAQ
jgi:hypothetical protein